MHRRSFVGALGGLALAGAAQAATSDKRTRFYALEHFHLKNGSEPSRLNEFFRDALLPAINRVHSGPKIYLQALIADQTPQAIAIYGFSSLDEMWDLHTKVDSDEAFAKKAMAFESGPEVPFESADSELIEAADYSPEIKASETGAAPRIFELRVYHAPSYGKLARLHERFRDAEVKIFHRVGIHPILYGSTLIGQNIPNLTYLIPFADLAAREKAWNAFGADPDWQKVSKESVAKDGQIVSVINVSLYRATSYSPVR